MKIILFELIISASRRTDIPAFYADWLLNSLYKDEFCIPNPYNPKQKRRLKISEEKIDGFVFWTKYPFSLFKVLNEFRKFGFPFYFQYTITPYDESIEPGLPKKDEIIYLFKRISDIIGPLAIYWRYDPIVLYPEFSYIRHQQKLEEFAKVLKGYTNTCIVSFYSDYKKCKRTMNKLNIKQPSIELKSKVIQSFRSILQTYNMELRLCADENNSTGKLCAESKCIDNQIFNQVFGKNITIGKDNYQRDDCLCSESFDIGQYKTCKFGCLYCYAK